MEDGLIDTIEFHGHLCPGLVIGYRVAKYALKNLKRSEDEELVCIAENSSCSVDAVQQMLGCTIGKGNLIINDIGKQVFTLYSRADDMAMRICFKGDISKDMNELRDRYFKGVLSESEKREFENLRDKATNYLIEAPDSEILKVNNVEIPAPKKARIYPSLKCEVCGESFMEICGRTVDGKIACIECFNRIAG